VARDLGGNGKLTRRYESVVGRHEVAGVIPIEIAAGRRENQEQQPTRDHKRTPEQAAPARLILPLRTWLRRVIVRFRGQIDDAPLATASFLRLRRSGLDLGRISICGQRVMIDHSEWSDGSRAVRQRLIATITVFCSSRHHEAPSVIERYRSV